MILRWRPRRADLERFVDGLVARPLTYDEVGATLAGGDLPGGRHQHHSTVLGQGDHVFAAAAESLRRWVPQRGSGFEVVPDDPPLAMGTDVAVVIPAGPVRVLVPCRVVGVVDEADRFGFAYGTLPGHPERGEESFMVVREADGTVRFEVTALSRPAGILRLAAPISAQVQERAGRRYLKAMAEAVAASR